MKKPEITAMNRGHFSLEGFKGVDPMPTLKKASLALRGFNHHISAGTALGIHRDKGFIPHDTDIDITVVVKDKANLELRLILAMKEFIPVRKIITPGRLEQLVFVDPDNKRMLVDVELYYTDIVENKMSHVKPEGLISLNIYKAKDYRFNGTTIKMPEPIEDYLVERYGEWQVPYPGKGDWKDYTECFTSWKELC